MNTDAIKARMKELKLTQKELADKVGISQAALSNIINGRSEPKEQIAESIAESLSLSSLSAEEWESWAQDFACPRCGSKAVTEFYNHASGSCRLTCGFCGLDTGDQKDRATALRVFASYGHKPQAAEPAEPHAVRVLSVAELLDPSRFDAQDVRPVWFENRGLFCLPALLQSGMAERERDCVRVLWFDSFGAKSYDMPRYGYTWRCWTGKPTTAQSDAAEWLT